MSRLRHLVLRVPLSLLRVLRKVPLEKRPDAVQLQPRSGQVQTTPTEDQYVELLLKQGGVCAICKRLCPTGRHLAVDHDHATGKVRGLLCACCNTALGKLQDSPEMLMAAAAYLLAHKRT